MGTANRRPRRLPARVYWFRRFLVLGTAMALVLAIARVIGGAGADDAPATAEVAGASTTAAPTATPTPTPVRPIGPMPLQALGTPAAGGAPVAEVQPDGPCDADDVIVAPKTGTAPAGRAVVLSLELTGVRPACTFEVTPKTVVAKVLTRKGLKVWSSQECTSAVKPASVVVRSGTPTTLQVTWSGRASDPGCGRATDWAVPGAYQVVAAAVGSEPSEATFTLATPPRPVVIKTIKPKPSKKKKAQRTAVPDTGQRGN